MGFTDIGARDGGSANLPGNFACSADCICGDLRTFGERILSCKLQNAALALFKHLEDYASGSERDRKAA